VGWIDTYLEWTTSGPKRRLLTGFGILAFATGVALGTIVGGGNRTHTEFAQGNEGGVEELAEDFIAGGEDLVIDVVKEGEELANGLIYEVGDGIQSAGAADVPAESHRDRRPLFVSFIVLLILTATAIHVAQDFLWPDRRARRDRR
jgi:hypothetical protein